MDIYFNIAFKPVATVMKKQNTINKDGEIEKELDVFIEELNTILSNDNQFNCEKVRIIMSSYG